MKLKLTGLELKEFLNRLFSGLSEYSSKKVGNSLHISLNWEGVALCLVIYQNKEFVVSTFDSNHTTEKMIKKMIKKQMEIEKLAQCCSELEKYLPKQNKSKNK